MQRRELGKSGLAVSPLCFGGNVFGWTVDEPTSFVLLDAFVASGMNFVDTADVYSRWKPGNSGGESETIIGKWLKSRGGRDNIVVATKVGGDMGQGRKCLAKSYIHKAVEDSLKRLQTDYIDLYQSHWDDPETPIEETLDAYGCDAGPRPRRAPAGYAGRARSGTCSRGTRAGFSRNPPPTGTFRSGIHRQASSSR